MVGYNLRMFKNAQTTPHIQQSFQEFKRENFVLLGPIASLIFILLSVVDTSTSSTSYDFWYFFFVRFLFVLPTFVFSILIKKVESSSVDLAIFFSFLFPGIGISIVSLMLGGLSSDYYFGLLIISFVQFSFVPIRPKLTLSLDILLFVIFFGVNTYFSEYQSSELVKQVSNYLSFALLKFFIARKSSSLMLNALKSIDYKKQLDNQRNIQGVLGELCHLFNNPLFISMSLIKKIKGEEELKEKVLERVNKIYEANERMNKVLQKMLALTEKDSEESVNIKDLLK
jgi:hypothetical protein